MTTPMLHLVPGAPRIALDLAGEGPLLLFLHGIGGNRTNWRANLPAFASHFACAAWDARGYGASDDYEGPLAFDDFVADVLRVLDHFGARRAHLLGLSMGGRIAMRTALLHPERVASLTLLDTHEGFESFSPEQRQAFVDSRRAPLLAGQEPQDIAGPVARSLAGPKARPEHVRQLEESIAALHKFSYIKSLEATVGQVTVGDISRITAPAHFIVGADDPLTPPAMHHEMAARLHGAPVSVLPDAGHLSNIENGPAFEAAALHWLLPRAGLADRVRFGGSPFRTIEVSDPALAPEGLRFVTVQSAALGRRADVLLFAPRQAGERCELPLVILLHGAFGSHWAWAFQGGAHRTAQRLIDSGDIPPLRLAMPSDGLWGGGSGYVAQPGHDVERWIVDEVPALAAQVHGAAADVPLCIGGLSMGGFGALRLAGKHPGRFVAAAAHSAVTEASQLDGVLAERRDAWSAAPEDQSVLAALRQGAGRLPPLRIDCGRDDFLIEPNRALHAALQAEGIAHTWVEHEGGHDWGYWARHVEDTLRFFGEALRRGSEALA